MVFESKNNETHLEDALVESKVHPKSGSFFAACGQQKVERIIAFFIY